MLRDDIARYTELSGEDGEHTSIQRIGAYLDGYDKGYEQGKKDCGGPKGEWVQISPARIYECSKCGQNVMTDDIESYKFCHGCGVKMGGDTK